MSHHIYHTRGLILGSIPIGESNKFYKIFTEELGLVWASAQAVRMEKSKLRYALQDFSWVTLDLVRGRDIWRITSAQEEASYPALKADTERFKIFMRLCALVSRMIHGERQEKELFLDLFNLVNFLESTALSETWAPSLETLAEARILARLGYFDDTFNIQLVRTKEWSLDILERFKEYRELTVSKIHEALHASHL